MTVVGSTRAEGVVQAAVYVRISSDRNGDELGVKRQERDCRKRAEELGWSVVEVIADDDLSAFSGRPRPGYDRLMGAVERQEVDAVIVWHPDRLHRSPKELERFIDLVESTRCRVVTCQAGEVDLTTAAGRMTARVVGAVARHESEQKGERLRSKHDELARRGRWSGGSAVYGYLPVGDGRLEVVPAQAEVIRQAAQRLLRGESPYAVVSDLNARGVPTARGGPWRPQTLLGIMRSGRIAGLRMSKGEVVGEATWDPILDRRTWERVQQVVQLPSQRGRRPRVALLAGGLARCGRCGEPLYTAVKQNGRRTYICKGPPQANGCGKLSIVAEPLEEFVTGAVFEALAGANFRVPDEGDDDEAARLVAEDETMLAELAADYASKKIGRSEWLAARDVVESRLRDGRRRLGRKAADPLEGIIDVRTEWPGLSLDQRRAIVAAVLDPVVVAPATVRGRTFDTGRIELHPRA